MRLNIFSNWWKDDTPRHRGIGFYEAMKPIHEALCREWYYNLVMLRGRQWESYKTNSWVIHTPSAPPWRVRAVFNKLLPLFITKRNKLVPNDPTITTRPANMNSELDKQNAELARQLLRAIWLNKDFQKVIKKAAAWQSCAIGYIETIWDDQAGREIKPPTPEEETIHEGDVAFEACSPFAIITDYAEEDFDNVRRYLKLVPRSVQYVKEKYGKEVAADALDIACMTQFKSASAGYGQMVDLSKTLEGHVMVFTYTELPSKQFPKGIRHTFTLKEDLKEGSLEAYKNGDGSYELPLVQLQDTPLPGSQVGTNSVTQAIPAQCFFNKGMSTIQENANRLGRPKLLAPKGSIERGAMIEDPAEIIVEYDPDMDRPTGWKPPEMAGYHLDNIYRMPSEMQDAFGIHDASMGILPRRANSGKLVNFLVDQDDKRAEDPRGALDEAIEQSFRKALVLAANGYTETRVKDLIGDDGEAIRRELHGENLRKIDVTITRDTSLPRSAAERMDLAVAVLERNPTKEQVEIMFAIMQASTIEDLKAILSGSSQAEETYARMENYDMRKGIPRPAAEGENHQMHLKVHAELMRDPNTSQEVKFLILQHEREHDQLAGLEAARRGQPGMDAMAGQQEMPPEGEPPTGAEPQAGPAPEPAGAGGAIPGEMLPPGV